uniref:Mothers against decapentaplegic homolog n=1 Tax=Meloidogyne incognita TaxID=6306 RepID=A0A914KS16_MELIC
MNIFSSPDPAVKKLLGWKLGDEEDRWALKAVDSLVKKMRKRKNHCYGTVEDLEYALANPGSRSRCVTIPRSLDGRLQVSHRKGLPHVIYCRVWRWPNLQSHQELKPSEDCLFPYDSRSEQICINPYHYHRVDQPNAGKLEMANKMSLLSSTPQLPPPNSLSSLLGSKSAVCGCASSSSCSSSSSYSSSFSSSFSTGQPNSALQNQQQGGHLQQIGHFHLSPSALSDDDDYLSQLVPTISSNSIIAKSTYARPQPVYWCSICYYELNTRVGEPFKVSVNSVVIDGFTDPSSESRICLGLLSNVNRNFTIENTRRHIGMGIRLSCTDNGVLLFNQSDSAVFVQSRNANFKYGLQATAVCRVPPGGASMLIFDYLIFGGMLEKAKSDGYQHVYELQKMCFVRLSFVKGWGADYHRQDVTSTPCWLELQLHQPMAWVDMALSDLEPPDHRGITSVS